MNLEQAIQTNRSTRMYADLPVPEDKLTKVLDAARLAPSWKNNQGWRYIAVTDREIIRKLGEISPNPRGNAFENAPVFLVQCYDPEASGNREGKTYYLVDAGISMQQAMLTAHDLGLGTCWVGLFPEEKLAQLFGVPQPYRVVAYTPLGVPAEELPKQPGRKELREVAYRNHWGESL